MKFRYLTFNTLEIAITILLNSCQRFQCQPEAKILFRNTLYNTQYNRDRLMQIIESTEVSNSVKQQLNKHQEYRTYLSDKNFSKRLKTEYIESTDVISFNYRHSDSDFAALVINNWMDMASRETRTIYSPPVYSVLEEYNRLSTVIAAEDTFQQVFDTLNQSDIYTQNLAYKDFLKGFKIQEKNEMATILISYEHPDREFASQLIEVWNNIIFDETGMNYDISSLGNTFKSEKIFSEDRLTSVKFSIQEQSIFHLKAIELANSKCLK